MHAIKTRHRGEDIFMLQISGGGKCLVGNDKKQWWCNPTKFQWAAVPSQFGFLFKTQVEAETVIANIAARAAAKKA